MEQEIHTFQIDLSATVWKRLEIRAYTPAQAASIAKSQYHDSEIIGVYDGEQFIKYADLPKVELSDDPLEW